MQGLSGGREAGLAIMDALIKAGADVDAKTVRGDTTLILSARKKGRSEDY